VVSCCLCGWRPVAGGVRHGGDWGGPALHCARIQSGELPGADWNSGKRSAAGRTFSSATSIKNLVLSMLPLLEYRIGSKAARIPFLWRLRMGLELVQTIEMRKKCPGLDCSVLLLQLMVSINDHFLVGHLLSCLGTQQVKLYKIRKCFTHICSIPSLSRPVRAAQCYLFCRFFKGSHTSINKMNCDLSNWEAL
jgi:hypothetical protein